MNDPLHIVKRRVIQEMPYRSRSGYGMAAAAILLIALGVAVFARHLAPGLFGVLFLIAGGIILPGLYMLQPNEAVILTLFGKYQGTDRTEGFRWRKPLAKRQQDLAARAQPEHRALEGQ